MPGRQFEVFDLPFGLQQLAPGSQPGDPDQLPWRRVLNRHASIFALCSPTVKRYCDVPFGGIEAGGTKFVCGVGTGPEDLICEEFPAGSPDETLPGVVEFFQRRAEGRLDSIGIGSFGPVDIQRGRITLTPKLAWRNFDFADAVRRALQVPVSFDTDVNAAALGEYQWGAAQGLDTFLYVTVGTGVGGGGLIYGQPMHGLSHPEMGHIRIPRSIEDDPFPGVCPSHGDCLEGLASGRAIEARWGKPGEALPADHPAWELEARYLAAGLANWICTLSPQLIAIGGGVLGRRELLPLLRAKVREALNGYVPLPEIVPPALGGRAGILGCIALAARL